MADLSRRGILGAFIAAPAIVRASSLMPVKQMFAPAAVIPARNTLLTLDQITREAIRLFQNSNTFLANLEPQWGEFHSLRVRLPLDYATHVN
jgi:hypothetical protein